MITAEFLSGCLNHQAVWESRIQKNYTEQKLCPQVFQKICQKVGEPEIDLFASRLSNQFPPIFTYTQGTKEGRLGENPFFDTDSTNLAGPDIVPKVKSSVNENSTTLTSTSRFLKEPSRGNTHPSSKLNNEVSCLDYHR